MRVNSGSACADVKYISVGCIEAYLCVSFIFAFLLQRLTLGHIVIYIAMIVDGVFMVCVDFLIDLIFVVVIVDRIDSHIKRIRWQRNRCIRMPIAIVGNQLCVGCRHFVAILIVHIVIVERCGCGGRV